MPDQDAWFGLLEPPPLGLLTAMVVAAQRRVFFSATHPLGLGGLAHSLPLPVIAPHGGGALPLPCLA